MLSILRLGRAALVAACLLPAALPALAGPAETALLQKYEGLWKGAGRLTGADSGKVACKMTLKMAGAKINYNGRCTLGSGTAGFRGTMHYNDAKKRFEAAATATGATGIAIGTKRGNGIVFAMKAMKTEAGTASSTMSLNSNAIKLEFRLVDKKGAVTTSSVGFVRG